MKTKHTSVLYSLPIIPFLLITTLLASSLAGSRVWLIVLFWAVSLFCIFILFKKSLHLPRPKKEYSGLTKIDMELPVDYGVDFYTCESMAKYEFMAREVEVLIPFFSKKGERLMCVINANLYDKESNSYSKIAFMRELEKTKRRTTLKVFLYLIIPLLTIISLILSVFVFEAFLLKFTSHFFVNFVCPFLAVLIISIHFFLWNRFIGTQETKLDRFLLKYFSEKEVISYLTQNEDFKGRNENEKHKAFNDHYLQKRINSLLTPVRR